MGPHAWCKSESGHNEHLGFCYHQDNIINIGANDTYDYACHGSQFCVGLTSNMMGQMQYPIDHEISLSTCCHFYPFEFFEPLMPPKSRVKWTWTVFGFSTKSHTLYIMGQGPSWFEYVGESSPKVWIQIWEMLVIPQVIKHLVSFQIFKWYETFSLCCLSMFPYCQP